ncbi:hypothetical protein ABIE67_005020 [Streptomyces sp. V4I8]
MGALAGISADDPEWIELFSWLTEVQFARLVASARRRGGEIQRPPLATAPGRPCVVGSDVLANRYHVATGGTAGGISKSAADRILDHLAPLVAISPALRTRKGTVYIVAGVSIR